MQNPQYRSQKHFFAFLASIFSLFGSYFLLPSSVQAATLSVSPTAGTFTVGSTFDVQLLLNTEGEPVNAVEASLSFPPDRLQLISPSTGKSLIGVWTAQPTVNNQTGKVDLQGGIPGGINVSSGLVTTLSFRVKSVGTAVIKLLDNSKVLKHDGKGTNVLTQTGSGVYTLVLPPPAGPVVTSETHPEQNLWYKNPNAVLTWATDDKVKGFSYQISEEPADIPDDIVDSEKNSVTYRNLSSGIKYFHIKALRDNTWGGTTHFAIKVDIEPPADFQARIIPDARTVRTQPIIQFETTDAQSGIDHYELKIVGLTPRTNIADSKTASQPLFIEVNSPFVPEPLLQGKYDIIIRAYDQAGNFREKTQRLHIVASLFEFISGEGIQLKSNVIIPWLWLFPPLLLLLLILAYLAYRVRKWRHMMREEVVAKRLPQYIDKQLAELARYQQKYGKSLVIVLCLLGSLLFSLTSKAAEVSLTPPLITSISENITNLDIFYVGGQADAPNAEVVVHLQNRHSGETLNSKTISGPTGEWFYRHDAFLPTGSYIVWAQTQVGDEFSPPSPQKNVSVTQTALQLGSSRLSFELIYLILLILSLLTLISLVLFIIRHARHGRRHKKELLEITRKAEESIRRGFALLKRDLQSELELVKKSRTKGQLTLEETEKEKHILADLEDLESRLEEEIWEIRENETSSGA
jgi:hypothetical protein